MKTESPQKPLILPALISIMKEVGAIDKSRENSFHKFKFRGIDDVYNALHDLFAKHGVICAPIAITSAFQDTVFEKKTTRSTVTKVTYRFQAADGSFYDTEAIGEGVDTGDKSTSKSLAFAHKYLLLQMFLIPTEEGEQRDPDYDSPRRTPEDQAEESVRKAIQNREDSTPALRWQDTVCHVGSATGPFLNKRLDAIIRKDHLNGSRKLYDALTSKFIPADTRQDKALKAALEAAGRELAAWEAEAPKEATAPPESVPEASRKPEMKQADWRDGVVPWGTQAGKKLGDLEWIVIDAMEKLIASHPAAKWSDAEKRFVALYSLARAELFLDDKPKIAEPKLIAVLREKVDNLCITEETFIENLIERGLLLGPATSLEQYDHDAFRMLIIAWNVLGADLHREFAPKATPDKRRSAEMNRRILAIDPGCDVSAYVVWENRVLAAHTIPNEELRTRLTNSSPDAYEYAIEMVACYGMPVGKEVFETCVWIGRFIECVSPQPRLIYRRDIKLHLCGSARAKDGNVRQALIDKYGPPGTKKTPGPTYGISGHLWSALAVACYALDNPISAN